MDDNNDKRREEIYSEKVQAGKRTYFFDVRSTRAEDYYMTITESKKFSNDDGSAHYKKHKIYLYKEDFENFSNILGEMTKYIIDEKGEEVISEIHDKDFKSKTDQKENEENQSDNEDEEKKSSEVELEDI